MKAYLHQVRISSKKVNVVASLVRGKSVKEALVMLKFTPKRSAPILASLIASAAANAENNFKQDADKLFISKLVVNEGQTLKRGLPVSRGRWHPILKRSSRITVELSPLEAKPEKKKSKKAAKAEVDSTEKKTPKVKKEKADVKATKKTAEIEEGEEMLKSMKESNEMMEDIKESDEMLEAMKKSEEKVKKENPKS